MKSKTDEIELSIVVPCYNEQEALPKFYEEANKVLAQMEKSSQAEFVFVDDGSKDGTLDEIKKLAKNDERIHYVSFSRNFGKEAALYAGLSKSKGKFTAVMDADLQDPPSLLPKMYEYVYGGGV